MGTTFVGFINDVECIGETEVEKLGEEEEDTNNKIIHSRYFVNTIDFSIFVLVYFEIIQYVHRSPTQFPYSLFITKSERLCYFL